MRQILSLENLNHSPLARALIGKDQNDVIELKMPSGITEYEISKVKYE